MMREDMALVREFAARQSEPAFASLVERHLGLVHSAAVRQTGDPHLAEEITQAVFILLARKARSLGPDTILSAWLYRATRYAAADALKIQRRRQRHEQEAYMQSTLNEPDADAWAQVAPLLDEAMAELGERDRAALVLRFFENKPLHEIAGALKLTEDAAQKRVARALEKLRGIFTKRGVTLTGAAIAGAVSANAIQAVPVGLAAKISAAAMLAGTTLATTLVLTALQKAIIGATLVVVVGAGIYEARQALIARPEVETLLQEQVPLPAQTQQLQQQQSTIARNLAGQVNANEGVNPNAPERGKPRGQVSDSRTEKRPAAQPAFEVEGWLQIVGYVPDGSVRSSNVFRFLARVAGEQWFLQRDDLAVEGGQATNDWRSAVACDGLDIYRTLEFPPTALQSDASTNLLYGFAEEGRFPSSESLSQRVLWLAFCSAHYLRSHTELPSIRDPKNLVRKPINSRIECREDTGLPKFFEQTCPGYSVRYEGNQFTKLPYPAPFDKGWVDYEYQVREYTNVAGSSLPATFAAGIYVPVGRGDSGFERICATSITGWVTRASRPSESVGAPALARTANICDYRFKSRTGRPFLYVEEAGGQWIQRGDPDLLRTINAKHRVVPLPTKPPLPTAFVADN